MMSTTDPLLAEMFEEAQSQRDKAVADVARTRYSYAQLLEQAGNLADQLTYFSAYLKNYDDESGYQCAPPVLDKTKADELLRDLKKARDAYRSTQRNRYLELYNKHFTL